MCLAIPAKVTALLGEQRATVSVGGVEKDISVALIEPVAIGDYVVIHVGYALTKLDTKEAEKTLKLFADMLQGDDKS